MNDMYQISLKSIQLQDNGMTDYIDGYNLLSATLVYPREGIQSLETIKQIPLESDTTFSFARIDFAEKLLFKESIQGDSAIRIQLSVREKPEKLKSTIQGLIRAGVMTGISYISGGIGMSIITAVAKGLTQSVFDLAQPSDTISILGQATLPISTGLTSGMLILNLVTPQTLKLKDRRYKDGKELVVTKTIHEGYGIAQIVLDLKVIPAYTTNKFLNSTSTLNA